MTMKNTVKEGVRAVKDEGSKAKRVAKEAKKAVKAGVQTAKHEGVRAGVKAAKKELKRKQADEGEIRENKAPLIVGPKDENLASERDPEGGLQDGVGGAPQRTSDGDAPRVRKLTRLSMVAIMYFSVAGGPEGTEFLIKHAGPLITFIGIAVLGVLFAVPLSLMTTELSTMYPENGGFVLWARAAFGDAAGGMAGWLQFSFSAVDSALYPGLFVTYLSETMDTDFDPQVANLLQAAFIIGITALNLAGIDSVGHGSMIMMLFLLTPFFLIALLCFTGIFTGTTINGWEFNVSNLGQTIPDTDWKQFTLVLIWNMGMWETASVCSGEVSDVSKEFPPALAITVTLVVLNYILPIGAFVGLDGDCSKYTNGYYIQLISRVGGKFWGVWLGTSQCVSAAGLFTNGIVKNAFMLCGMGEQGMLPTVLAHRMPRTGAPWIAIAVTQFITVSMVLFGGFRAVLGVDMLLYSLNLLLEIASLMKLRRSEPHLPRPFKIPANGIFLWLVMLPSIMLSMYVICSSRPIEIGVAVAIISIGFLGLFLVHLWKKRNAAAFSGVDSVVHVEHREEEEPMSVVIDFDVDALPVDLTEERVASQQAVPLRHDIPDTYNVSSEEDDSAHDQIEEDMAEDQLVTTDDQDSWEIKAESSGEAVHSHDAGEAGEGRERADSDPETLVIHSSSEVSADLVSTTK